MVGMYGNGIQMTEKALDFLWGRQSVTLNNIANVDTPGFKSQYVTFEAELKNRIESASLAQKPGKEISKAISAARPSLKTTWTEGTRLDGNNVDMDQEQVELVRTAYQYQALVTSISNDLNGLRSAAKMF
ncbi:MAG: flagellar basal body rod protein FlgB [Clostridium sp.]